MKLMQCNDIHSRWNACNFEFGAVGVLGKFTKRGPSPEMQEVARFGNITDGIWTKVIDMPKAEFNPTVPWKQLPKCMGGSQYGQEGQDQSILCKLDVGSFLEDEHNPPQAFGFFNSGIDALASFDKHIQHERERGRDPMETTAGVP